MLVEWSLLPCVMIFLSSVNVLLFRQSVRFFQKIAPLIPLLPFSSLTLILQRSAKINLCLTNRWNCWVKQALLCWVLSHVLSTTSSVFNPYFSYFSCVLNFCLHSSSLIQFFLICSVPTFDHFPYFLISLLSIFSLIPTSFYSPRPSHPTPSTHFLW